LVALILSIALLSGGFGLVVFYTDITAKLPSLASLPLLLDPTDGLLMQPTRFYDRTGEHVIHTLQNPAIKERKYLYVPSQDVEFNEKIAFSDSLLVATIAISDPTFWSNAGYSLKGISEYQHNTIAQRLASELLLWDEAPNLDRAIRERILAGQITSQFGREKVMEWYLNSAYYGSQAYGADAASQIYLGKSAAELNLAEAAILAGVSESPALNPFSSPQTAVDRGYIVIDAMEGQGLISLEEAKAARKTRIAFKEPVPSQNVLAPQFIDLVRLQVSKSIPIERVERGGFNIITSLDLDLQIQTECTAKVLLSRLSREDPKQGNYQVSPSTQDACPASKLLPTLSLDEGMQLQEVFTDVVVYDPFNSQILALVSEPATNNRYMISEGRPPGSLFSPFVYLTAFTRGFNPASLLWDIPLESTQLILEQLNPNGQYKGPLRLRNAFATDKLVPAAKLISQIGIENILKIARQLGLSSLTLDKSSAPVDNCPGCQFILGEGQITLLEAVQAFGVFSNQGYFVGLPSEQIDLEGGIRQMAW